MSNGFVSIAKKDFPNAKICIDPFHVINSLNDMVDSVRRRYQHTFQENGETDNYKKVKNIIRLLKTKQSNQQSYWGPHYNENLEHLKDEIL